jgi:PBSX family phage terminase large subunit
MDAVDDCSDSDIWMIGKTSTTIFNNAISLLLTRPPKGTPDPFSVWRPFCMWRKGDRELLFKDKVIKTLGVKDDGAIGAIQGSTMSLCYCDEMTLYSESVINMIDTRLSKPYSMLFASMNPSHPNHILKTWIDKAEQGDPNYYELHYTLDDNPYVPEEYKNRIRNSLSGLFYKRNYLGIWCLADGAIFDFFDRDIYVVKTAPRAAEYFIAGIDVGFTNAFACVIIGISTGRYEQSGPMRWVEKEYYWDISVTKKGKTHSEFADDIKDFLEPYGVRGIYVDPSAASFKEELRRRGLKPVDANNDVLDGISYMSSEMQKGNLFIMNNCKNLIREIEGYVWDSRKAEMGLDAPLKKNDHACVAYGTEIMTPLGMRVIDKFAHDLPMLSYDVEMGMIERDIAYNPSLTRENAIVYELELEDGKKLVATGDHQILTKRGYIELQQLTLSDIVLTCTRNISEKNSI